MKNGTGNRPQVASKAIEAHLIDMILRRWITLAVLVGLSATLSCNQKQPIEEETEQIVFLNKISGDWRMNRVQVDGLDVTKSFPGLSLVISPTRNILVTNPVSPIWKTAAQFTLEPTGASFQLKRDDGVLITVEQPSATQLALRFQYDPAALGGRAASVKGAFTFLLDKK